MSTLGDFRSRFCFRFPFPFVKSTPLADGAGTPTVQDFVTRDSGVCRQLGDRK